MDTVAISLGTSVSLQATGCSGTVRWLQNDGSAVTMPITPKCSNNYHAVCDETNSGVTCTSPSSKSVFLQVNYPFSLTCSSIVSTGDWENASTWSGNRVPTNGDLVIINNNQKVFITTNTAKAQCLSIGGTAVLQYSTPTSKLSLGFQEP
jgi:hypothetical protein